MHFLIFIKKIDNIAKEFFQALKLKNKKEKKLSRNSFFKAIDIIDTFIININKKIKKRLKKFLKIKDVLMDDFYRKNMYQTKEDELEKYFYYFNNITVFNNYKI